MSTEAGRGAVFLDRDGTIIVDSGYLFDPAQVQLLPHAADGLGELASRGWPLVIVSNQSGIARGMYGPEAFASTHARLAELVAPRGVSFTGVYCCPHHPAISGPCECRKPGVKLFRDAAREHGIDLGSSYFVGDRWRDVEPAITLGGRGLLVGKDPLAPDAMDALRHHMTVVPDLAGAARAIGGPRR